MVSVNFFKLISVVVLLGHLFESVVGQGVGDIVTQGFFDGLKEQNDACAGKNFYSRDAFLEAASAYGGFGGGTNRKHEIAAFFANAQHETGRFCFIEEQDKSNSHCENSNTYPCNPSKQYYGRGPLQITGNINYGAAGQNIGFNGLDNPEIVANERVISFKTALWFWMTNVHDVSTQGFGATIRKINPRECDGGNRDQVQSRVKYYRNICQQLNIQVLDNLEC